MKKLILLTIIVLLIAAFFYVEKKTSVFSGHLYNSLIVEYSKKFGVNPNLVRAVIKRESNFNPKAVSPKGAQGLMQIMPRTAKEIAEQLNIGNYTADMLKEPSINIMFGAYYLKQLISYYDNNLILALAAYNAGIGNVDSWIAQNPKLGESVSNMPFNETKRHVRAIILTYKTYNAYNGKNKSEQNDR